MTNFVRAANPIWFFVDLQGLPLNDEYWISFLENTSPFDPQPVFQDPQGITPWTDPLQFYPNGTLPNNLYFDDTKVYRLEIRQGPLSSDPLIYEIDNFIPEGSNNTQVTSGSQENQISNPQFAFVDFTIQPTVNPTEKTLSITTAGTYQVGPDWFFVVAGTGTATLTQVVSTGDEASPTDPVPPYALKIETNGWSSAILYQRFEGVASIWANLFVSMSIIARSDNGFATPITLNYAPQSPGTTLPIVSAAPPSIGNYALIEGCIPLPPSTNTNLANLTYIDMQIVLPNIGSIVLSDVQVMGQNSLLVAPFLSVPDETLERQLDKEFHYYADSIIFQPKDTILSGWNFPLNPWQFASTTISTISSQCVYVTDQTILYQTNASSVAVGRATGSGDNFSLSIQAVGSSNNFALIQYIDASSAYPYWNNILSSLVNARLISGMTPTIVKFKMRLIYRNTIPSTLSPTEPIASIDSNGDPVFSSGWTAIKPINDPTYVLGTTFENYPFNGFQMPSITSTNMTLGIVLYTTSNMSTTTPDQVIFQDVSLVPNEFAIESNALTFDETLARCSFYFESSYPNGVLPGTATTNSQIQRWQLAQTLEDGSIADLEINVYPSNFEFEYRTTKRTNPSPSFFSPSTGTINMADIVFFYNGANHGTTVAALSNWTASSIGTKSAQYDPANDTPFVTVGFGPFIAGQATVRFQYALDARLGYV